MRVLYVEDNPANVFLVKRVAKMGNHEIINYIDGDQALSKFADLDPDLVLMDIQLAGDKSGLDVVRELRKRGTDVPIIAVTAYAMVGDRERCIDAGCTDYLAKPLPIPRLVEIFQEYAAAASAKTQPEKQAPKTVTDKASATSKQAVTDETPITTEENVKESEPKTPKATTDTQVVSDVSAKSPTTENDVDDDETLPEIPEPVVEGKATTEVTDTNKLEGTTSADANSEEETQETEPPVSVTAPNNVEEKK